MNEPNPRIAKIVAGMIRAIHARPRQVLNKLSAADAEEALAELDGIDRETARKQALDARALDRIPAADDLRKNYASTETDLTKVMAQVHDKPHRVAGYRRPSNSDDGLGPLQKGGFEPKM